MALGLLLMFSVAGRAEVKRLVIGRGGVSWGKVAEEIAALEDTTVSGSLQPREFHPWENVLLGPRGDKGQYRNLLGFDWAVDKAGKGTTTFKMGLSPRFWRLSTGDYEKGVFEFIDGNPDNAINRFPPIWTFDLGIPLPLTRIVFYPPAQGMGVYGEAFKNMFPREYEVTGALDPPRYLLLTHEAEYHPLAVELGKTYYNNRRVTQIEFPPTVLRFFRLYFGLRTTDVWGIYTLSEIEAYAEGFPPKTWYVSRIIDMEQPVNFGRIYWGFSRLRKQKGEAGWELDPEAPVRLSLETRSGNDQTPLVYHVITEIGKEREVSEQEYNEALEPSLTIGVRPGDRGSVADDVENWSFWSSTYRYPGQPVESPDGRRYLKLKFTMESDDVLAFGRLDSIAVEYSSLLAERVLGEVALLDQPQPPRGVAYVPAGQDTVFTYDLRASFSSASQPGFDAIRLLTPSAAEFVGLEMGEPLIPVEPDSLRQATHELVVYFPSHRVNRDANQPIRILFRGAVLSFSSYFTAEVFASEGETLPQSIDPGDANSAVSTDGIQVFSSIEKLEVFPSLDLASPVVTPNGDGVNDRAIISFTLLGIDEGTVTVVICSLDGREARTLVSERLGQEVYKVYWDGMANDSSRTLPGIYLCRVSVETDSGTFEKIRPIAVAY
jgi:hypothetical protein